MRWSHSSGNWPSSPATTPSWRRSASSRRGRERPTGPGSIELLDQHIAEPDRRALRLPADRTAVDGRPGPTGDLDAIDRADDGPLPAGHFLLIPLADGLDRLLLR